MPPRSGLIVIADRISTSRVWGRVIAVAAASHALATSIENLDAARSTLLDVDMAAEMTKFTSLQVLTQAGVAMLAQANQMPQNLLQFFDQPDGIARQICARADNGKLIASQSGHKIGLPGVRP